METRLPAELSTSQVDEANKVGFFDTELARANAQEFVARKRSECRGSDLLDEPANVDNASLKDGTCGSVRLTFCNLYRQLANALRLKFIRGGRNDV